MRTSQRTGAHSVLKFLFQDEHGYKVILNINMSCGRQLMHTWHGFGQKQALHMYASTNVTNAMQVWIFNIFKIWQEHNISSCRGRSFCIVFQALKWNSFCTFDNENASEGMRQPNASGVQCVYEFVIVRRCVLDASSKEQKHNALFSPIFQRFQV